MQCLATSVLQLNSDTSGDSSLDLEGSLPSSPHTNFFAMQGTSTYPNSTSRDTCWAVIGCRHMAVFIAGQKSSGRLQSQARTTHVWKKWRGKHQRYWSALVWSVVLDTLCTTQNCSCSHQQIVTDATGELSEGVGIERRDEQKVGPAPQLDVKYGVGSPSPQLEHRRAVRRESDAMLTSSLTSFVCAVLADRMHFFHSLWHLDKRLLTKASVWPTDIFAI